MEETEENKCNVINEILRLAPHLSSEFLYRCPLDLLNEYLITLGVGQFSL